MASEHHDTSRLRRAVAGLGTILSVWAHPDDETYLAAGIMAAARDNGQRVVCVSATAGEHGTSDPETWPPERLGRVRRWETAAAMAILGIWEHRVLGYEDGTLVADDADASRRVAELLDEVRPDTVLTFGPDGVTFHPDHIAVHRWVTSAWHRSGCRGRLLHAASSAEHLERHREELDELDVYMSDERPRGVPIGHLALHVELSGVELDRKVAALRAMWTQTAGAFATVGADSYAAQVAEEAFVAAPRPVATSLPLARSVRAGQPEHVLGDVIEDHLL